MAADTLGYPNVKVTQCQIELEVLRDQFSLNYGDEILAKVEAINERGWSDQTMNDVAPLMEDIPRKMDPITQGAETTNTVIHIEWTMPDDAGSPVIGYIIKYKFTTDEAYQELVSNYNQLSYKITLDVVEGAEYMFIGKAVNKWGQASEWSDPVTILAATVPEAVSVVSSEIEVTTGGLLVSWETPHHRGTQVTSFEL